MMSALFQQTFTNPRSRRPSASPATTVCPNPSGGSVGEAAALWGLPAINQQHLRHVWNAGNCVALTLNLCCAHTEDMAPLPIKTVSMFVNNDKRNGIHVGQAFFLFAQRFVKGQEVWLVNALKWNQYLLTNSPFSPSLLLSLYTRALPLLNR